MSMFSNEIRLMHCENRIENLGKKGQVNENLIRKARRIQRKLKK